MSDLSILGEGLAKKSEANSQQAHLTSEYRAEQSAALKAKHKEVVGGGVKLIALGVALFVAGTFVFNTKPSWGLLTLASVVVMFVGALSVLLGLVTWYYAE